MSKCNAMLVTNMSAQSVVCRENFLCKAKLRDHILVVDVCIMYNMIWIHICLDIFLYDYLDHNFSLNILIFWCVFCNLESDH